MVKIERSEKYIVITLSAMPEFSNSNAVATFGAYQKPGFVKDKKMTKILQQEKNTEMSKRIYQQNKQKFRRCLKVIFQHLFSLN